MQVIWLYVIGLVIILFGLFTLTSNPGPTSFVVMLVGLAIAAIGAAHGRRMRDMGELNFEEFMHREEEKKKAVSEAREAEKEKAAEEKGDAQDFISDENQAGKEAEAARKPRGFFGREAKDEKPVVEEVLPSTADEIELVCTRCGSENVESNYFCASCGNRLRRKPQKPGKEKKPDIAIDPGLIEIIDGRKIAKVVVCPKCNASNRVADKFCSKCGKKLKPEHMKNIEIA